MSATQHHRGQRPPFGAGAVVCGSASAAGDEVAYADHVHLRGERAPGYRRCWCSSCRRTRPFRAPSSAGPSSTPQTWDPVAGQFGALPFIYGTVVTSALALLIGIPLGVGAAIFLAELAPPPDLRRAHLPDRVAGGRPQRDLRTAREFSSWSRCCAPSSRRFSAVLGWTPAFSGTVLRRQYVYRGRGAGDHDPAVHHFDFAGSDSGRSRRSARSRAGAWARPAGRPPGM